MSIVQYGIAGYAHIQERIHQRKLGIAAVAEFNCRFSRWIVFVCAGNDCPPNNQQLGGDCSHDLIQYALCLCQ